MRPAATTSRSTTRGCTWSSAARACRSSSCTAVPACGLPSMRYLERVDENLRTFEPAWLRQQVMDSWAREASAQTAEDFASIIRDQWPFQFADPLDPRIEGYLERSAGLYAPDVLRHFASDTYGGIEAEDRLAEIAVPVLVFAGRHDRTCVAEAAEAMAAAIQGGGARRLGAQWPHAVRRGDRGLPGGRRRVLGPRVG